MPRTVTVTLTHCTAVSSEQPLDADALAHACGAGLDWIARLADSGIVDAERHAGPPHGWRFDSPEFQRALAARRLERDYGVDLDAAALILDLQQEVRRLRGLLGAHGLRP